MTPGRVTGHAALAAWLAAGCYGYAPLAELSPRVGAEVRVELAAPARM
ncbi:MAG TPA: hypothetical protein VNI61_01785 [Gemmatimonadales bacterium]|nr:hypothetical protein [Gemmatimonadales bacterium]